MKRTFSIEQNNYLVAKANYEVCLGELRKLQIENGIDEMYEVDFDKAFDLDEALSEQVGDHEAFDLLNEAELQLVEWGFAQVQMQALYKKNLSDLEALRNKTKESVVTRSKVAEVVMKLVV